MISDAPLKTLLYSNAYKGGVVSWLEILLILIICLVLATVTFMDGRGGGGTKVQTVLA